MNIPVNRAGSGKTHRATGRISVLIVPEAGTPRRYNVKVFWLKFGLAVTGVFIIVIILAGLSYSSLLKKALERDHLIAENARLLADNERIVRLAKDVEESRLSLERIVRSLGGKLDLSHSARKDSL